MKKILLIIGIVLLVFSCMTTAHFITYDIYSNYGIIYNKDVMLKDQLPPEILDLGEGFVMYMGTSDKTLHKNKHTLIYIDQYMFAIKDKVDVPYKTPICVEVVNGGEAHYTRYVIIEGHKYKMSLEQ